jgi:pimeloyl-ACP methyl ester carboxylesterase
MAYGYGTDLGWCKQEAGAPAPECRWPRVWRGITLQGMYAKETPVTEAERLTTSCIPRVGRRHYLQLAVATVACLVAGCRYGAKGTKSAGPVFEPTGFVDSDNLKIYYESVGDGHPIILVHGWGSSLKHNWVDTGWVEALKARRLVVTLDVRGHGESDKPHDQAVYSYARMSRDVLRVMDHLGIAKADFLGYSMGSFMGVSLLGHARERFTSMILGGIGDETDQSLAVLPKIVAGLRAADSSRITDAVALGYRAYARSDQRNDLEALSLSALQMWPEGLPLKLGGPALAEVDIPILIVNGANDHPYIDTVHRLVDAIPGARLVVIPDRDHLGVVTDQRFKDSVLAFLDSR